MCFCTLRRKWASHQVLDLQLNKKKIKLELKDPVKSLGLVPNLWPIRGAPGLHPVQTDGRTVNRSKFTRGVPG